MNTMERAMRKVLDAAAPHPYDTRTRSAVLDEAEAKALAEHVEWLRRERSTALDALDDIARRQRANVRSLSRVRRS
jgi:hypothetical protein